MPGTNDGRPDTALLALIREHSRRVPAGSVDWNALAARIVEDGRGELAALHRAAYDSHGVRTLLRHPAPHRWWEVTAGWIRPAIAAALVVSAISTAVVLASPSALVADAGDTSSAAWLQTFGATGTAIAATPANRDSLFDEVIGQ
jgi:hypothetical protein